MFKGKAGLGSHLRANEKRENQKLPLDSSKEKETPEKGPKFIERRKDCHLSRKEKGVGKRGRLSVWFFLSSGGGKSPICLTFRNELCSRSRKLEDANLFLLTE